MKVVVLGASPNEERYSFRATKNLLAKNHEVYPVGIRQGKIENLDIIVGKPQINDVHTVTLYLGADNQKKYYDYIFSLQPKRIIFNPGAENNELYDLAESKGIETIEACTLVMLSIGNF